MTEDSLPIHNPRLLKMWEILSEAIDFRDLYVVDLGCGYGDLLWRIAAAGARLVLGIERDLEVFSELNRTKQTLENMDAVHLLRQDIRDFAQNRNAYDVAICCSVLPYLQQDRKWTLDWMAQNCDTTIIECQYAGDGPGLAWIHNDDDMRTYLQAWWSHAIVLGNTLVEGRQKHRTIWLCTD